MSVHKVSTLLSEHTTTIRNGSFIKHPTRRVVLVPSCLNGQQARLDDVLGIHFLRQFWSMFDLIMILISTRNPLRKRQVWVEPKFGELKQWHLGRRFRLRGFAKVNIEALLHAAGQNIKQLLKAKKYQNSPLPPCVSDAISVWRKAFSISSRVHFIRHY